MATEYKYDVFISYRRVGGKEIARNVQLALQKNTDWKVFLDLDDLDEGRFDPMIMAAIEEAPTFIVILSSGALDRCAKENDWMRKEILYAHQLGKDIIPLEVDKCYHDEKMSTIPKIVGDVIGTYQFAALDTETLFKKSIEKLIDRIRKGGQKIIKDTETGAIIHVVNDYPCWVYHYRKEMLLAKTEEDNVLHLRKGRHLLEFKAVDCPQALETKKVEITDEEVEDMVEVNLKEKVEAIQKKAEEQKRREEEERPKFNVEGVEYRMIKVEGGSFWMGVQKADPSGQNYDSEAWSDEERVHKVTLRSFYMSEVVVTQALWQAVMGNNPSSFEGPDHPVECVSWNDCQSFVEKLNEELKKDLNGCLFRLPKEAEWEYAALGGNKSKGYSYAGSDDIDKVAWYWKNSGDNYLKGSDDDWDWDKIKKNNCKTHPVKQLSPNELGIYDMSGNVWEWCEDLYEPSSSYRVLRGGSWGDYARGCRVSNRLNYDPDDRHSGIGFRLVLPQ